jgi:L-fuculose-phosphate aldolase
MSTQTHLRKALIATAIELNTSGINQGTSGNVSVRSGDGFLITPSGIRYSDVAPEDVVLMDLAGVSEGLHKPSSEWRFHRDIYAARHEAAAIVHTHSVHATALACLDLPIPAFHYMVAAAGGHDIRCAPYATFGTQALSDFAVAALDGRWACLLSHHGVIALGNSLSSALALAAEIETLAHQYLLALGVGKPKLLADSEMDLVVEKFKRYGLRHPKRLFVL